VTKLDYVEKAVVNRGSYEVGQFKWDVVRKGNEIHLHFNSRGNVLEFQRSSNAVTVSSSGGGGGWFWQSGSSYQVLKVKGPLPLLVDEDSKSVTVPLVS